jgi:hypothetical protein
MGAAAALAFRRGSTLLTFTPATKIAITVDARYWA